MSRAFPDAARAFRAWTIADAENLTPGQVHVLDQSRDGRDVIIASMVTQAGFGPGATVRLCYDALAERLGTVAEMASRRRPRARPAHRPRASRGPRDVIADLIDTAKNIAAQLNSS